MEEAYKRPSQKVKKVMVQPINVIFRYLQNRTKVSTWLVDHKNLRIDGVVVGFDEYMNIMLDNAEEVNIHKNFKEVIIKRRPIGRILLKGDCVVLMHPAQDT